MDITLVSDLLKIAKYLLLHIVREKKVVQSFECLLDALRRKLMWNSYFKLPNGLL